MQARESELAEVDASKTSALKLEEKSEEESAVTVVAEQNSQEPQAPM